MVCPSCGAEMRVEDKFCRSCGVRLPSTEPEEMQPGPASIITVRSHSGGVPGWAIVLVLLCVGLTVWFLFTVISTVFKIKDALRKAPNGVSAAGKASQPSGTLVSVKPTITGPHLRIFKPGDSWSYTATATVTRADGTARNGTGTLEKAIFAMNLSGAPCLVEQTKVHLVLDDGTPLDRVSHLYFQQGVTGDDTEIGVDDGSTSSVQKASQPGVIIPGDWTDSPSSPTDLTFGNGMTEHLDTTVVPGDNFMTLATGDKTDCWTFNQNTSESDGSTTSSSGTFSPGLGQYVNGSLTTSIPNRDTVNITETLTSYALQP